MFWLTAAQPSTLVKIAPGSGAAMKALAAVNANSANAANAINVIRDVKNLDLWEREFEFVVIIVNLLCDRYSRIG
jgi:hypothetical protein